jgi:hypothetical protein
VLRLADCAAAEADSSGAAVADCGAAVADYAGADTD